MRGIRVWKCLLKSIGGEALDSIDVYLDALDESAHAEVPLSLGAILRWPYWWRKKLIRGWVFMEVTGFVVANPRLQQWTPPTFEEYSRVDVPADQPKE